MQRYFSYKFKNNIFELTKDDMYHIKTVMRSKDNDTVEIVYQNTLYTATLKEDKLYLKEQISNEYNNHLEYILCLPLLTDNKMSFILQKATELGITKIVPIITNRSIAKFDKEKEQKKLQRYYKICKEASEQSKRLDIPVITGIKKLTELDFEGLKLVCSTTNKTNKLRDILKQKTASITFLIGPEGGLDNNEENLLIDKGFIPVTLGQNILRVETVPIFILSILKYEE